MRLLSYFIYPELLQGTEENIVDMNIATIYVKVRYIRNVFTIDILNSFDFNVSTPPNVFQFLVQRNFFTDIVPEFILSIVSNVLHFVQTGYVFLDLRS